MNPRPALLLLLLAACGRAPGRGGEREPCQADRTCDVGLACMSDVCVRPPPADCDRVAEALAAFEIGNYATPERRAEVVARERAHCASARLTLDEGACVAKAEGRWAARDCAPRLLPELVEPGCDAVVAKLRAMLPADRLPPDKLAKALALLTASCTGDHWPAAIKACFVAIPDGDRAGGERCAKLFPKDLERKLKGRMAEVR